MKRLTLSLAVLASLPLAAHADTVINLNATTGNASTSYGGGYNNLAPTFFSTVTLGPGTYTLSAINGVYQGWDFASTGSAPAPGDFTENVDATVGGSFTEASAANGYQNSYTVGTTPVSLFSCNYASDAAALAAATPLTFTLASTTAVTFYIPDGSFNPNGNAFGFDDNSGGVSLDIHAVTPEPSSIALLGTGLLGVAGVIKRRMLA